jgi:hypothetical protein
LLGLGAGYHSCLVAGSDFQNPQSSFTRFLQDRACTTRHGPNGPKLAFSACRKSYHILCLPSVDAFLQL